MKKPLLILMLFLFFASDAMAVTITFISDSVDPATCVTVPDPIVPSCPVSMTLYRYADSTYTNGVVVVADHPVEADMSIKYDAENEPDGVFYYKALYKDQKGLVSLLSNGVKWPPFPAGVSIK